MTKQILHHNRLIPDISIVLTHWSFTMTTRSLTLFNRSHDVNRRLIRDFRPAVFIIDLVREPLFIWRGWSRVMTRPRLEQRFGAVLQVGPAFPMSPAVCSRTSAFCFDVLWQDFGIRRFAGTESNKYRFTECITIKTAYPPLRHLMKDSTLHRKCKHSFSFTWLLSIKWVSFINNFRNIYVQRWVDRKSVV